MLVKESGSVWMVQYVREQARCVGQIALSDAGTVHAWISLTDERVEAKVSAHTIPMTTCVKVAIDAWTFASFPWSRAAATRRRRRANQPCRRPPSLPGISARSAVFCPSRQEVHESANSRRLETTDSLDGLSSTSPTPRQSAAARADPPPTCTIKLSVDHPG